jgi:two-component system, NtrC family, nitrogen regulation sensor histidine kinase GlnL
MSGVTRAVRRTVLSVVRRHPSAEDTPFDPMIVLGALPVPLILLDAEDRFRYANQAAEQFLGISLGQLMQMSLHDVLPADSPLFLLIGQLRTGVTSIADHELSFEGPRLRKTGISVQGTALTEDPGSVVLVLQDGTMARALDRQISARTAARSITGMATILAHEVKNPLSGIRGAAQLLEASVGESDRELAVLIRDEADRIRALVDRMEDFGEKPILMAPVNIHRVLEHVRRVAATGFAADIRFSENYDPSLPPVLGNRDQLVQVLLNLVKNAAEALQDVGGTGEITLITRYQHGLRLGTSASEARVHLPLLVVVRDSGPGIPDDLKAHLFEPFVSGRPAGQGLGLSLVAKIIADHGGLIEVESMPGRTEFRLHLPMVSDEDGE